MPIFCVKSVKIYTGEKKFTRIYSWHSWQISGMARLCQVARVEPRPSHTPAAGHSSVSCKLRGGHSRLGNILLAAVHSVWCIVCSVYCVLRIHRILPLPLRWRQQSCIESLVPLSPGQFSFRWSPTSLSTFELWSMCIEAEPLRFWTILSLLGLREYFRDGKMRYLFLCIQ